MSIEYRSRWLRAPEAEDKSQLAGALAAFGRCLGEVREDVVVQIEFWTAERAGESGPDVTVYADDEGLLVSFHSVTRAQRTSVVARLDEILLSRRLGTPLEEE